MKRKNWIIGTMFVLILLCLLGGFVACKASVKTPILGDDPRILKAGELPIKVTIDSKNFPSYRTVVPEEWTETKKNALWFVLEDDASSANRLGKYQWSSIKEGSATVILPGSSGTVNLFMTAYDADPDASGSGAKIVLKSASTTATIGSTTSLDFVMRPYRLTKTESDAASTGTVDITVVYHDPDGTHVTATTASLTKLDSAIGNDVSSISGTDTTVTGTSGKDTVIKTNFEQANVTPAVYTFKATLTAGSKTYTVSDIIVVDPGMTSKEVLVCPTNLDDLNSKPKAPSNFKVDYIRPAGTDSNYSVKFTWEDRSLNETGFKIVITNQTTGAVYKTYDTTDISANTESFTVPDTDKLSLNTKYSATIVAVGSAGSSTEVAYTTVRSKNIINLNRITYDLGGATLIAHPDQAETDFLATKSEGTNFYAYYTFSENYATKLLGVDTLPSMYKLNASSKSLEFLGWNDTTNDIFQIPKNTASNYTLTAKWGGKISIDLEYPSYKDEAYIENSCTYIAVKKSHASSKPNNVIVHMVTDASLTGAPTVKWFLDGGVFTPASASSWDGTAKTLTLDYDASALSVGSIHQLLCVIEYTVGGEKRVVSTYCYIRVE